MTEPPAFTMTHAAEPPVYAAPARADFPNDRPAHQLRLSPQETASRNVYPVNDDEADIPTPPDTRGATLIVAAVIWWTVMIGIVVLAIWAYQLAAYSPPLTPAPCVVSAGHTCDMETSAGHITVSLGYAGQVYASTDVPTPIGRKP
jgi:hypothetical protein